MPDEQIQTEDTTSPSTPTPVALTPPPPAPIAPPRVAPGMIKTDREQYGRYSLAIRTGSNSGSLPETGATSLGDYTHLDIVIQDANGGRSHLPSKIGLPSSFDVYFTENDAEVYAPCLDITLVDAIRAALGNLPEEPEGTL